MEMIAQGQEMVAQGQRLLALSMADTRIKHAPSTGSRPLSTLVPMSDVEGEEKPGKKRKRQRASNGRPPKLSGYIVFAQEKRASMDKTDITPKDIVSAIGHEWSAMTAEEKQVRFVFCMMMVQVYNDRATAEYAEKIKVFEATTTTGQTEEHAPLVDEAPVEPVETIAPQVIAPQVVPATPAAAVVDKESPKKKKKTKTAVVAVAEPKAIVAIPTTAPATPIQPTQSVQAVPAVSTEKKKKTRKAKTAATVKA
jgi:hypothetical protein